MTCQSNCPSPCPKRTVCNGFWLPSLGHQLYLTTGQMQHSNQKNPLTWHHLLFQQAVAPALPKPALPDLVHLWIDNQKNGHHGQIIAQHTFPLPSCCPLTASISRILALLADKAMPGKLIYVYQPLLHAHSHMSPMMKSFTTKNQLVSWRWTCC